MRAVTWLVGVMVILLGFEHAPSNPASWTVVWVGAAVLWFLVGCVLCVLALSRLTAGKLGGGLNAAFGPPAQRVPPPVSKE